MIEMAPVGSHGRWQNSPRRRTHCDSLIDRAFSLLIIITTLTMPPTYIPFPPSHSAHRATRCPASTRTVDSSLLCPDLLRRLTMGQANTGSGMCMCMCMCNMHAHAAGLRVRMAVTHIDPLPTAGVVMAGGPRHDSPCGHQLGRAAVEGQQALGGLPFGERVDRGGSLGGGITEDDLARRDLHLDGRAVPIQRGSLLQRLDVLDGIALERNGVIVQLRCHPADRVDDGRIDQRRVAVCCASLEDGILPRVLPHAGRGHTRQTSVARDTWK